MPNLFIPGLISRACFYHIRDLRRIAKTICTSFVHPRLDFCNSLYYFQVPVYIAGDFNIRLDRLDDPHSAQFHLLADCYGLTLHHTDATHQLGGTLDAVITREDAGRPDNILVVDVGLSDHYLLQWSVDTTLSETPVVADCRRSWRQLAIDQFRSLLSSSTQTPGQPTSMQWLLCMQRSSTVY